MNEMSELKKLKQILKRCTKCEKTTCCRYKIRTFWGLYYVQIIKFNSIFIVDLLTNSPYGCDSVCAEIKIKDNDATYNKINKIVQKANHREAREEKVYEKTVKQIRNIR